MQYYESPAYGEWCKRIYGNDLKQMGMVTMEELELFYREVKLPRDSKVLDIGCGPGYIAAAIAEHYNSHVTGIDIDEAAITHAIKTFSNNLQLSFQISDGNKASYDASSFDLIYLFDTLYFTHTIERLRLLLDKCLVMLKPGGKLAVFWSNLSNDKRNIFNIHEPGDKNTQVGIWCDDNNVQYKAFDLTESYRKFWLKAMDEIVVFGSELNSESPELYSMLMNECMQFSGLCEQGDSGGLYRWLYVISKSSSNTTRYI